MQEQVRLRYNEAIRPIPNGLGRDALIAALVERGKIIHAWQQELKQILRERRVGPAVGNLLFALENRRKRIDRALWLALDLYLEVDPNDVRQTRSQRTASAMHFYNGSDKSPRAWRTCLVRNHHHAPCRS